MGKLQHFIQTLHDVAGGAGFVRRIPTSALPVDVAVVEGQLLLNILLGSKSTETASDFVSAAAQHARAVVAHSGARQLIVVFDDKNAVSGAKQREQRKRTESAVKATRAKQLTEYSQQELDSFFVLVDKTCDGSGTLSYVTMPQTTTPHLPVLERLRATPGSSAVYERAVQLMVNAMRAAPYVHVKDEQPREARHDVQLVFVVNSVVEFGSLRHDVNNDQWAWVPLTGDGSAAPRTLGEAEELAAHYALTALRMPGVRIVYVRCSDTDVVPLLAHGVQRLGPTTGKCCWLDLNQSSDVSRAFGDEQPASSESDKGSNSYAPYVDMIRATESFMAEAQKNSVFSRYTQPLHVLSFVTSLGGTDNVDQLPMMSGEAWLKAMCNEPDVGAWLAGAVVHGEPVPQPDTWSQPLRTYVQEYGAADEFVAHQFALKMPGKKWSQAASVALRLRQSRADLAARLDAMATEATTSYEKRKAAAEAKYAVELAEYTRQVSQQRAAGLAPDGTLNTMPTTREPRKTESRAFIPLRLGQVQSHIRRAHWQLQKFINGSVDGGVPAYDAVCPTSGRSLWGWSAHDGEPTDDIVEWSNDIQLLV